VRTIVQTPHFTWCARHTLPLLASGRLNRDDGRARDGVCGGACGRIYGGARVCGSLRRRFQKSTWCRCLHCRRPAKAPWPGSYAWVGCAVRTIVQTPQFTWCARHTLPLLASARLNRDDGRVRDSVCGGACGRIYGGARVCGSLRCRFQKWTWCR